MVQWQNYPASAITGAIHQCVQHTWVTYVVDAPLPLLLQYLATTPFYLGADQLYYLILKAHGKAAHYSSDGRHLVTIAPELAMVYILAEQDTNALATVGSDTTIADLVAGIVPRMMFSPAYSNRMNTIIGTVPLEEAIKIPRVALCVPEYQKALVQGRRFLVADLFMCKFTLQTVNLLTSRCSTLKATCPDLWDIVLQHTVHRQLEEARLRRSIQGYPVIAIKRLGALFPQLIACPAEWGVLATALWFSERRARAYLLGYDLDQGCPSNHTVCKRLVHLNTVGLESYVKEITGVHVTADNRLTGYVGQVHYDSIAGKKLGNSVDSNGIPVGWYYPYDIVPLIYDDTAYLVPLNEFRRVVDYRDVAHALAAQIVPYLPGVPSRDQVTIIIKRLQPTFYALRNIPVHQRLLGLQCQE